MNKKRLLFRKHSGAIPLTYVWKPVLDPYFDFGSYSDTDDVRDYDPENDIIWAISSENCLANIERWLDAGYKVVLDYLWDHYGTYYTTDNILLLKTNNVMLMHESLHYQALGYKTLDYNNDPNKLFLCLMNQSRPNRVNLYERIKKYSDTALISFIAKGITLLGDVEFEQSGGWTGYPSWQNFANMEWYNSTAFSLVSETGVGDKRFYTEKSLKPFAHKHPSVIWGPADILKRLRRLGFETFGHIIDESYDDIESADLRLEKLCEVVDTLNKEFEKNPKFLHDARTKEILEHNQSLFYNTSFVDSLIESEVLTPLRNFIYD